MHARDMALRLPACSWLHWQMFYIVGCDHTRNRYRTLFVERSDPTVLRVRAATLARMAALTFGAAECADHGGPARVPPRRDQQLAHDGAPRHEVSQPSNQGVWDRRYVIGGPQWLLPPRLQLLHRHRRGATRAQAS